MLLSIIGSIQIFGLMWVHKSSLYFLNKQKKVVKGKKKKSPVRCYNSHFSDEERKVQNGSTTCPKFTVAELSDSRVCVCCDTTLPPRSCTLGGKHQLLR